MRWYLFLVIDNYDSFTFNLVQLFQKLGEEVTVYRNDEITVDEVLQLSPQAVIISPGPCTPNESGVCLELTAKILGRIPLLGVCLGLQVIGQHLGGKIITADLPFHGKTSFIEHDGHGIYQGISSPLEATRYHSLILDRLFGVLTDTPTSADDKKEEEANWSISKEGEMHLEVKKGFVAIGRINPDGSITAFAVIEDGIRIYLPKDEQLTGKKIK